MVPERRHALILLTAFYNEILDTFLNAFYIATIFKAVTLKYVKGTH